MSPLVASTAGLSARALGWGLSTSVFDLEWISTTVLSSATASVTFNLTALQQATYKHLQLRIASQISGTGGTNWLYMRLNGDSTTNYTNHVLDGTGSAVQSQSITPLTVIFAGQNADTFNGASNFSANVVDILDAFSTTKNKTTRSFVGVAQSGNTFVSLQSGMWMSTAAISSLTFTQQGAGNLNVGSRFSLYGVR